MSSLPAAAHPARLQRLVSDYAAPDYVMEASSDDLFAGKTAVDFADPATRLYPIHTKAAAWMSAAAADDGAAGPLNPYAAARLATALRAYKLEQPVKTAAALKTAADELAARRYALPTAGRYPIQFAEEVKAAAEYFSTYGSRMDPADRREFAANTARRAVELDCLAAGVLDKLQKEAGEGLGASAAPFALRAEAAERTGRPALAVELRKAAADYTSPVDAPEAAALLRSVDATCGWDFPDPIDGLVTATKASAAAALDGVVRAESGNWYLVTDLDRLPAAVKAAYGAPPVLSRGGYERLLTSKVAAGFEGVIADYGVRPAEPAPRRQADWAGLAALAAPAFGAA